jgi:CMP-N-acetylneuraminic acid synthetase
MRLEGDRLVAWAEGPAPTRRQDKPLLFARNGPAVLAVRTPIVSDARSLYGADTRGLVMTRAESFDIDDAFDLELAGLLMKARAV